MSASPFITQQLKDYLNKHQIESNLNQIINKILHAQPQDPYAILASSLQSYSSSSIEIKKITLQNTQNSEGIFQQSFVFKLSYLAKEYQLTSPLTGIVEQEQLQKINDILINMNILQQKKIDETLQNSGLAPQIVQMISYSLHWLQSRILNLPQMNCIQNTYNSIIKKPQVFLPVIVSGKGRVSKLYAIFNEDVPGKVSHFQSILRKILSSGKQGEAGVKMEQNGSFQSLSDGINDNIKLLEEVIVQSGQKDEVKIGLCWQGDLMWQQDKQKYEVEGPKQLYDTDQMIEFYYKLCQDKPIISYMEDPLLTTDDVGYNKMIEKFASNPSVKIASRKVIENGLVDVKITYAVYKYSEFRTITHLFETWKSMSFRQHPCQLIIESNVTETADTSHVDFAFGLGCALSLAPPAKYERLQAFNQYGNNVYCLL